jgi:hypothetical protein
MQGTKRQNLVHLAALDLGAKLSAEFTQYRVRARRLGGKQRSCATEKLTDGAHAHGQLPGLRTMCGRGDVGLGQYEPRELPAVDFGQLLTVERGKWQKTALCRTRQQERNEEHHRNARQREHTRSGEHAWSEVHHSGPLLSVSVAWVVFNVC